MVSQKLSLFVETNGKRVPSYLKEPETKMLKRISHPILVVKYFIYTCIIVSCVFKRRNSVNWHHREKIKSSLSTERVFYFINTFKVYRYTFIFSHHLNKEK